MSEQVERDLVDDIFAGSERWENMQVLADDIGSRLAGSTGEVEALLEQSELLDTLDLLAAWPPEQVVKRYFEEGV